MSWERPAIDRSTGAVRGSGGRNKLLAFNAPDIQQDPEGQRIDPDAPWADEKLTELQSSLR